MIRSVKKNAKRNGDKEYRILNKKTIMYCMFTQQIFGLRVFSFFLWPLLLMKPG